MNTISSPQINILYKIPTDIFKAAKQEIECIDWNNLPTPDLRSKVSVFKSSISNHLRVHKIETHTPDTPQARADIIECTDTKARILYPAVNDLVLWAYHKIEGLHLGRIMIVNLQPKSEVGLHKDIGKYFQFHYRLHIPLVTYENILFVGPPGTEPIHMPEGFLCQLRNQNTHGVVNNSNHERIHLIFDVSSKKADLSYFIDEDSN